MAEPQPPTPIPGARLLFSLDPGVAHLNHGSFGAVPINVQRAQQRLRDEVESNPLRFFDRGFFDRIAHTRRHLASFLGADPDRTALVGNATTGIAIALQSLRLRPGDEILTTSHGYGSISYAVQRECDRTGATAGLVTLPLRARETDLVAQIGAALRPDRTKLLIVDQVTSATAYQLPVATIATVAARLGVAVLVDGAHAPGMLPIEVDRIGADFWVGNFHKWAYAPRGTAVLSVAQRWVDQIEPLVVSWQQPNGFPDNVEFQATLDYTPWLAAPVGLFTLRGLGLDRVREHNAALAAYGQRVIGTALGLTPEELPDQGGPDVPMRLIPLPEGVATTQPEAVTLRERISDELKTEVSLNSWNGRGWLRICGQVYNHAGEYERFAESLPSLLR
ncbi:aminotransferase class V [Asanoa ishikariensis]|uniref:Isopenicillin-N epimerase n=1 Tax=Asanoa ishikariensis TaxID=137265 RepID=A0A1H3RLR7_9ACTN|nr:aminotransferase class V-fold PLP-dependent enzyme [Asanoa ishikariensis]GIF67109.1 aminotransferase class V [Asanoa ishikariensis]SDZ26181.1 isopenicillin-N epimerase [Asanoa ishikariensis]